MKRQERTILIIEDDPDMLALIKRRLEASAFRCLAAENPVDGLQKAVREKPDLILLDLMLPKMSGFGFLRIAKGNPSIAGIPIVVLTALNDAEIAREAMDLGAAAYLSKTSASKDLIATVRAYV